MLKIGDDVAITDSHAGITVVEDEAVVAGAACHGVDAHPANELIVAAVA